MVRVIASFAVQDYVLFGCTLLASAAVGIFFSVRSRVNDSPEGVIMGGGHMPLIPTALSLLTSFVSGITLLALPVEIYRRGALFWLSHVTGAISGVIVAILVMPIFYHIKPTSVYQYLEQRFQSRFLRLAGAVLYLLYMLVYMGLVLYGPSIALSGVTGVHPAAFYVTVGLVCLIYTSIGGLKAVVYTDTLQAAIMIAGILAIFFKGCVDRGGVVETFNTAAKYGRFESIYNFDPNPFQYMTFWTAFFGGIGFWLSLLTFNQISVQRYLAIGSINGARKVLLMNIPGYIIFATLGDLMGIVIFSYYLGCDPFTSNQINKKDQLVIFYALDVLGNLPGLPGIFLACVFSGTLSTISSGINSMAAVLCEDFFDPYTSFHKVSQKRQSLVLKIASGIFGLCSIGLAFLAAPMGGMFSVCIAAMGALGAPLAGLFVLGTFFPLANFRGAVSGLILSAVVTFWVALGNALSAPYANYALEASTSECMNEPWNLTDFIPQNTTTTTDPFPTGTGLDYFYGLSPVLYPVLGIFLVLIIGIPVSLIGGNTTEKRADIRKLTIYAHLPWATGNNVHPTEMEMNQKY